MKLSLQEIISATMVLFAVIDIIGSIPLIVSLRERVGHIQSEKATLASVLIMVLFLFFGENFLHLFGVDIHSFAVAGSFVLFILALEMILGIHLYKDTEPDSASIVPIAFPLIAGAGTLTTLVSIKSQFQAVNILIAIFLNALLVYFVLKNSKRIADLIGKSGINILRKVFGIVLLAIAVRLFTSNWSSLLS